MMIIASDALMQRAAAEGGWVAMVFVVIVISGFSLLGWMVKSTWYELKQIQLFQQNVLVGLVQQSNMVMGRVAEKMRELKEATTRLEDVISNAPCGKLLERIERKP